MPGDNGEDDGSYDGRKEGLEEKSAENKDAKSDEEEGDLLPWQFPASVLHQVIAPFVDWMLVAGFDLLLHFIIASPWFG